MPELPEVETVKRGLGRVLVGRVIRGVEVRRKKSFVGDEVRVEGKKIKGLRRRGKILIIDLSGSLSLVVHLKFTGQLVYRSLDGEIGGGGHPTNDWIKQLPGKHTRIIFELDKGSLYFNDLRVFGWVKILKTSEVEKDKSIASLGPDGDSSEFTVEYLREVLEGSKLAIKQFLHKQEKIAGLGNIYINEALFCAKISPFEKACEVAENGGLVNKLYGCIKKVLERGKKLGGASVSNFVGAFGEKGKSQESFFVYKREGEKCRICEGKIKREKLSGRSLFWCPKCQKC